MAIYILIVLFTFFISLFGQPPLSEVEDYVQAINKLEQDALGWVAPTDFSSYFEGYDENAECTADGTYDIIIVGAGSAGSVLANRLSENSNWDIQLLEAGYEENNITDIPGVVDLLKTTQYNWGFSSYPQKGLKAYINSSMALPIGRALGGSSVLNYMMYVRGNKEDFNIWEAMGNPGWSYKNILPYFIKSEHATFRNADSKYHGRDGTLNVEYVRYFSNVMQSVLDGEEELGRKVLSDYNGEEQLGFGILQMNEINGSRDSAARAFLYALKDRSNLHISPGTFVLNIMIDEHNKKAYGVKYVRNGNCYYSRARKEVIVSAGALNSPRLLMLSGIGPRRHLKELGIPVLQDLDVGENLWSHVAYPLQIYTVNYTYPNNTEESKVTDYLQGKGIYTTAAGIQAVGFVNLGNHVQRRPNVEYAFALNLPNTQPYEMFKNIYRYTEEEYKYILKPLENYTSLYIYCGLLHEKSRGAIHLKSASPLHFPLIYLNYFDDPEDVETLVYAIKDIKRLAETLAMQKLEIRKINVSLPICEHFTWESDDFWRCMIRNAAANTYHHGGTCKMGPKSDGKAVVDARLRVYGIENLRVVDTSVMPTTSSGHTNAVAYVIAEKAADIIKEDYNMI